MLSMKEVCDEAHATSEDLKRLELELAEAGDQPRRKTLIKEVEETRRIVQSRNKRKVNVVLNRLSERRNECVEEIKIVLREEVAAKLASLIASDLIQDRLLGKTFDYDKGRHPDLFSGAALANAMLESIPARLRPPELNPGRVEEDALWYSESVDSLGGVDKDGPEGRRE